MGAQIVGGLVSAAGIFLPGTFLIFFVVRFWDSLKKFRVVRASLEGIAAALGCSLGTVKSRLFHALEKLRSMNVLKVQLKAAKRTLEPYETLF